MKFVILAQQNELFECTFLEVRVVCQRVFHLINAQEHGPVINPTIL